MAHENRLGLRLKKLCIPEWWMTDLKQPNMVYSIKSTLGSRWMTVQVVTAMWLNGIGSSKITVADGGERVGGKIKCSPEPQAEQETKHTHKQMPIHYVFFCPVRNVVIRRCQHLLYATNTDHTSYQKKIRLTNKCWQMHISIYQPTDCFVT